MTHPEPPPRRHRVLVTGGSGFLGQRLVPRLLAAGYVVTATGMSAAASPFAPEVEFLSVDLRDRAAALALLQPWRWDAAANLAGPVPGGNEGWPRDFHTMSAHVNISLNVCAAAAPAARIVHTSSMTVYGFPRELPVAEEHPREPLHCYGAAKVYAEDVFSGCLADGGDLWVLRLPGLFSEARKGGALYHFARAAVRGEELVVSAAQPTPWEVLHVDDAVHAILLALRSEERNPGAVNVGYGEPVDLLSVARWMAQAAGAGSTVRTEGASAHPEFVMEIARARRTLGWSPAPLHARLGAMLASAAAGAL